MIVRSTGMRCILQRKHAFGILATRTDSAGAGSLNSVRVSSFHSRYSYHHLAPTGRPSSFAFAGNVAQPNPDAAADASRKVIGWKCSEAQALHDQWVNNLNEGLSQSTNVLLCVLHA